MEKNHVNLLSWRCRSRIFFILQPALIRRNVPLERRVEIMKQNMKMVQETNIFGPFTSTLRLNYSSLWIHQSPHFNLDLFSYYQVPILSVYLPVSKYNLVQHMRNQPKVSMIPNHLIPMNQEYVPFLKPSQIILLVFCCIEFISYFHSILSASW